MTEERINKRFKILMLMISLVLIVFLYFLILQMGIVPGADEAVDKRVADYKKSEEAKLVVEGSFLDRNNELITVGRGPGEAAECKYPEIYSSLIGYNSNIYGLSGLRYWYADKLLKGGNDYIGASIKLTIDSQLQEHCYQLLGNNIGSITILDNDTGAVLAMANRSDASIEYDVNSIDKNFETYAQINEFFYNRALLSQDPPGSTFKIVTSAALVDANEEGLEYYDEGVYKEIKNAKDAVYGQIDLQTAFTNSVNTYFAHAGDVVGKDKLEEIAESFLLGQETALDFGVLNSYIGLEECSDYELVSTAFGQGNLMVSPLNVALLIQPVAAGGNIYKPYMVDQIIDDGITKTVSSKEVISTIPERILSKLKELTHEAALSYGFDEETFGIVYAKTGTAEVSGADYNHIYLIFATENYTGVISYDRSYQSSHALIERAQSILRYLN